MYLRIKSEPALQEEAQEKAALHPRSESIHRQEVEN